jgi:hypothetical protein
LTARRAGINALASGDLAGPLAATQNNLLKATKGLAIICAGLFSFSEP